MTSAPGLIVRSLDSTTVPALSMPRIRGYDRATLPSSVAARPSLKLTDDQATRTTTSPSGMSAQGTLASPRWNVPPGLSTTYARTLDGWAIRTSGDPLVDSVPVPGPRRPFAGEWPNGKAPDSGSGD